MNDIIIGAISGLALAFGFWGWFFNGKDIKRLREEIKQLHKCFDKLADASIANSESIKAITESIGKLADCLNEHQDQINNLKTTNSEYNSRIIKAESSINKLAFHTNYPKSRMI